MKTKCTRCGYPKLRMTDDTKQDAEGQSSSRTRLSSAKRSIVYFLLRMLRHHPGTVIGKGRRKYVVDSTGAWRRLGRDA